MLAPGGAHCGGGSEFASSVPPRGPGAPLDRAPSGAGGGLPAGRRPVCDRGPPLVAGSGSGLDPPHPPPGRDPRGAPTRPNPGLQRPEFFRIFAPLRCSAQGGWGGSAHYPDPTAQSAVRVAKRPGPRTGAVRAAPGGQPGPLRGKKPKKNLLIFGGCCCARARQGCGNRLRRCGRRSGCRPTSPNAEVSDRKGRGATRRPHPAGALLGARPFRQWATGGRGRHSRDSGRVWLSQTASSLPHLRHPCAGLPSLALREVPIRALRTPHARKAARGSRRSALP